MARLLSRCVHTSSVHSWIETVNVGSYNKISRLRPHQSRKGPHPGELLLLSAMLFYTQGISAVSPPLSTGCQSGMVGGDCEHASPLSTVKGRLCNPAQPIWESSGFMLVQVLALYPSPVPVCIPGQISLTFLALHLPTYLSVRHFNLGMEVRRS